MNRRWSRGIRELGLAALAVAVVVTMLAPTADARPRFGLEAGVNVASLAYDEELTFWDTSSRMTFVGGATVQFPLSERFGLKTGVRYVQKGNDVEFIPLPNVFLLGGGFHVMQNYLTVPLWLEVRPMPMGMTFLAGPEVGFLLSARQKAESIIDFGNGPERIGLTEDIRDQLEDTDLAMVVGMGVEFPLGTQTGALNVRYSHGLVGVAKEDAWFSDWKTRGLETTFGLRW